MITVLLAAGTSSRMGSAKLLLPYQGKPLILHALDAALAASERVIVVTGCFAPEVTAVVQSRQDRHPRELKVVHNEAYEAGQFSSTRIGVEAIDEPSCFTIALGDAPLITQTHYYSLLPLLADHDTVRPYCTGVPGHPVLCAERLIPVILSLPQQATMRELLAHRDVLRYDTDDPAWITDIDTPEAYERLLASL